MQFEITDVNNLTRKFESEKQSLAELISSIEQSDSQYFQFETTVKNILKPYAIHVSQIVSIHESVTQEDIEKRRKPDTTSFEPF